MQGFENSEEELRGWEDWRLKDLWCSGLMGHPVFLQAADVAEQLARAECQDLLYG